MARARSIKIIRTARVISLTSVLAAGCGQATTSLQPGPANTNNCVATTPPADEVAVHDVRFDITNTSTSTWYVGDGAQACRPWTLATTSGRLVPFGPDEFVWCEGFVPAPHVVTWTEVAPGQTIQREWDGRHGKIHLSCRDCTDRGVPGRMIDEPLTQQVVAASDDYVATFAVVRTRPAPPDPSGGTYIDNLNALCPEAQRVSATFRLPATGAVVVPVDMP